MPPRSIKECLQMARQDLEVLTSLLDARFLCGMSPLYHQLMERLRIKVINAKSDQLINGLIELNQARHTKFGDSAYLLEPNLKEGQGGLRDYPHHALDRPHPIQYQGETRFGILWVFILRRIPLPLRGALGYVWDVRNHLHLLMKRKCDQLHLENQLQLAEAMKVKNHNGHLPVEVLLGELHGHMEFIKQCYQIFVYELDQKKRLKRKNKALKETKVPGLKFNRGMLNFVSPENIVKEPQLLIKIFLESIVHKAPLSAEARRLIREFGYLITKKTFRNEPEVVMIFEKIMARPMETFYALGAMLETGFLVAFIPEFKPVVNRIQFDQYHLYPVARHLLQSVLLIKQIGTEKNDDQDPLGVKVYQEIRSKRLLLWAALLHDIGKGDPTSGHSERGAHIAVDILSEKGLAQTDLETVEFLIRNHLLLFETATRRDINDEETALMVAPPGGQAGTVENALSAQCGRCHGNRA